jgi:hypothetical protein
MKNKQQVITIIIHVLRVIIIIITIIINNVVMIIIIVIVHHHLNIKDNHHHLIVIMIEHFSIEVEMVSMNKLYLFVVIVFHVLLVNFIISFFFCFLLIDISLFRYTRFKCKTYSIEMSFT